MSSYDDPRHDRFLQLFAAHEPALRAFARSLVPTREDMREVMQEVALVLWRKFPEARTPDDFRRFAYGVVRMQVLSWRRDRARDRHLFSEEAMLLIAAEIDRSSAELDAQHEALEECLKKLPPAQRELIDVVYGDRMRIDRLAQKTGRTAMAIYKTLHRLRLALLDCTRQVLAREGSA